MAQFKRYSVERVMCNLVPRLETGLSASDKCQCLKHLRKSYDTSHETEVSMIRFYGSKNADRKLTNSCIFLNLSALRKGATRIELVMSISGSRLHGASERKVSAVTSVAAQFRDPTEDTHCHNSPPSASSVFAAFELVNNTSPNDGFEDAWTLDRTKGIPQVT
ncbi:hypothetical protein NLI96_g2761 [Meripilus lineatus]|uniref:Uncharacterized protein n=1 Tax=Meripilus lineatus TaxID=2056292 RepID=A0AAD5YJP9_9APHY|nr:hypothetical protein NLI96_g2761 [Physisporinus lineatus]